MAVRGRGRGRSAVRAGGRGDRAGTGGVAQVGRRRAVVVDRRLGCRVAWPARGHGQTPRERDKTRSAPSGRRGFARRSSPPPPGRGVGGTRMDLSRLCGVTGPLGRRSRWACAGAGSSARGTPNTRHPRPGGHASGRLVSSLVRGPASWAGPVNPRRAGSGTALSRKVLRGRVRHRNWRIDVLVGHRLLVVQAFLSQGLSKHGKDVRAERRFCGQGPFPGAGWGVFSVVGGRSESAIGQIRRCAARVIRTHPGGVAIQGGRRRFRRPRA